MAGVAYLASNNAHSCENDRSNNKSQQHNYEHNPPLHRAWSLILTHASMAPWILN